MLADLKFALRQLAKSPGFALVAILSLGLGIGANTAVFSLVNATLLRLLPVRDPQELVLFKWLSEAGGGPRALDGQSLPDPSSGKSTSTSFSIATFEALARHHETLSDVFAFAPLWDGVSVNVDGQADIVAGAQFASGGYHAGLGIAAAAGRLFTPADDRVGAPAVAVISHRYWQRRFAADPAVIGRPILVNQVPVTIIGVTAPRFAGTLQVGDFTDLTLPLALSTQGQLSGRNDDGRSPGIWWVRIMGRLKPGVTAAQAQASLEGVFQETARGQLRGPRTAPGAAPAAPPDPATMKLRADPGGQGLVEARRVHERSLGLLLVLVGLVLLVACANVANLLLARGVARRREIAVRLSLGASRGRLVRQLLAESLLLSFLGAAAGVAFAAWGRDALLALHPLGGAAADGLAAALDLRVLAFTSAIAVFTGALFGLVPALRATRVDLNAEFQGGARTLGAGSRSTLAKALMTTQVALSLVLLVGAGLFVRTLRNLQDVDLGFARERLVLFRLNAVANGASSAQAQEIYQRVADRLGGLPGVRCAGYSQIPLLTGGSWSTGVTVPGYVATGRESVRANAVDPDFFATLGVPVLHGRAFTAADRAAAPKVAVVNQAFARKYFPDENPVGRRIGFGGRTAVDVEIVGVVRDAQYFNVKAAPPLTIYLPFAQQPQAAAAHFVVRLAGDPAAIVPGIRAAVRTVDATLPLYDLRTQEEQLDRLFTQERLFARLCGFFGGLALLLAAVGLYGLMSYAVVRRTGEIGLRMALGALPRGVLWMIVRESLGLVLLGTVLGLAAAWGASRWIASMLFGLSATDPATYASVAGLLIGVALLAAMIPARRASRVDPMEALRAE